MKPSKLAVLLLGIPALLWALLLFVVFPFLQSKKVDALVGQTEAAVREKLGAPAREWPAQAAFTCDDKFPCDTAQRQGGASWLYSDGKQGVYLHFGADGKLAAFEPVRPGLDAGTPRALERGPAAQ